MRSSSDGDLHIDAERFGKKARAEINAEASKEKALLGMTGRYKRFRAHINGLAYEIPVPDVKAIRERLHLSQAAFAQNFNLSERTIQQWEQRRALPDMPARVLLKVIQLAPEVVEKAAAAVREEIAQVVLRGKASPEPDR